MEGFEKIGELIFCPFVHYAILLMSISELDLTTLDSNGPSAIDTFVAVRQGEMPSSSASRFFSQIFERQIASACHTPPMTSHPQKGEGWLEQPNMPRN